MILVKKQKIMITVEGSDSKQTSACGIHLKMNHTKKLLSFFTIPTQQFLIFRLVFFLPEHSSRHLRPVQRKWRDVFDITHIKLSATILNSSNCSLPSIIKSHYTHH